MTRFYSVEDYEALLARAQDIGGVKGVMVTGVMSCTDSAERLDEFEELNELNMVPCPPLEIAQDLQTRLYYATRDQVEDSQTLDFGFIIPDEDFQYNWLVCVTGRDIDIEKWYNLHRIDNIGMMEIEFDAYAEVRPW